MELSADLEPSGSTVRKRTDNGKRRAKNMSSGSDPPTSVLDAVSICEQQVCPKETYLGCTRGADLGGDKLKLRGDRSSIGYLGCGAQGKRNRAGGCIAPV